MALKSISLRGFRNLEPTAVEFAEGANYVFGPNGAGKTNLLEAIHYLAIGRSFRRCSDAEMLGFGREVLVVSGADEGGDKAEIRFDGREKRILRNDIPVERLSEYFGWLPVVVLLLEDIELVRGSPSVRRGYLDMAVAKVGQQPRLDVRCKMLDVRSGGQEQVGEQAKSEGRRQSAEVRSEERSESGDGFHHQDTRAEQRPKSDVRSQMSEVRSEGQEQRAKAEGGRQSAEGRSEEQSYIELMGQYRRAVGHYNRLLERSAVSREPLAEQLSVWEEELVRTGVPVYESRQKLLGPLLEGARRYYERLARHDAEFGYWSSVGDGPDYASAFRARLAATRARACQFRHVLVGPHRDDIRIRRGERDLRRFGSVGEQRLAGIALRLAEADMLLSAGRQRPVFLLDEVASELDEERSRLVLEMVTERGQMVYAAARRIAPPQVQSPKDKEQSEDAGSDLGSVVRDAAALDHLTARPLEHSPGKEFHVEAGTVSEVS